MTRWIAVCALVFGFGMSAAQADDDDGDYKRAGHKGTVTAYELDGTTVLVHKVCLASGRRSWNYVECGTRLRDRIKVKLCSKLGKGTHKYIYQIGDGKPSKSTVYCKQ